MIETYPRFTMIAGDVEAVRGAWAIRGEAAAFVDRTFQPSTRRMAPVRRGVYEGHAIEAGGSVERKAGDYRINLAVLMERQVADSDAFTETDVSLVMGAQRSFARDTRRVLLFGLWNMADRSGFLRSIGSWSLRDNLWLEGSVGWFLGEGTDTLSRFATRDFAYVKLKSVFLTSGQAERIDDETGLHPREQSRAADARRHQHVAAARQGADAHRRGGGLADDYAARVAEALEAEQPGAVLKRVLVTHAHSDHVAGIAALRRRWPDLVFAKIAW